jgi:hypothetical protein
MNSSLASRHLTLAEPGVAGFTSNGFARATLSSARSEFVKFPFRSWS